MNPELKAKWVAALRSGEYSQCKGELERIYPDGRRSNCCLGVLGRVMGVPVKDNNGPATTTFFFDKSGSICTLPFHTRREIGLDSHHSDAGDILMRMNDDEGKSFAEIADWIEENL